MSGLCGPTPILKVHTDLIMCFRLSLAVLWAGWDGPWRMTTVTGRNVPALMSTKTVFFYGLIGLPSSRLGYTRNAHPVPLRDAVW